MSRRFTRQVVELILLFFEMASSALLGAPLQGQADSPWPKFQMLSLVVAWKILTVSPFAGCWALQWFTSLCYPQSWKSSNSTINFSSINLWSFNIFHHDFDHFCWMLLIQKTSVTLLFDVQSTLWMRSNLECPSHALLPGWSANRQSDDFSIEMTAPLRNGCFLKLGFLLQIVHFI